MKERREAKSMKKERKREREREKKIDQANMKKYHPREIRVK